MTIALSSRSLSLPYPYSPLPGRTSLHLIVNADGVRSIKCERVVSPLDSCAFAQAMLYIAEVRPIQTAWISC